MRKTGRKRAGLLLALCLLPALSSCAPVTGAHGERTPSVQVAAGSLGLDTPANLLISGYVDPKSGFHAATPTFSSREKISSAAEQLIGAGVLAQSEWEKMELESAASRALFIRLVAAACCGAEPSARASLRSDAWYGPYVRLAYELNLFPDNGLGLSFLPADGFCLGDEGYAPMLEPVGRGDAHAILKQIAGRDVLPVLSDGLLHEEGVLSQGDALVCAQLVYKAHDPSRRESPAVSSVSQLLHEGRILHAGGYIKNQGGRRYSYTNSVEALVNAYTAGARLVEFDFTQTSDGHQACIHDWQSSLSSTIREGVPKSLEEWLETKVYDCFSPLCLESLASFMRSHPDLYVVTDVKSDNEAATGMIAEVCPDLRDRFVIQIYKDSEYEQISGLGFSNLIYTLYNLSYEAKMNTAHLAEFAAEHPLAAYTFPSALLAQEGYAEKMLQTGVPLCVHTLNNADEIKNAYKLGVTAVYTDTLPE